MRSRRTMTWMVWLLVVGAGVMRGQGVATVPVVMLSDIHFDPFHDPAKFERLREAPVAGWQKILAEPDAPTQQADFDKLVSHCKARGFDTPWTLMESSFAAAKASAPHALFVTVSGDLVVHQFDCKYRVLVKHAKDEEYSEFVAKTEAYVASELHRTFGATPVYIAMGNNDSGCGDYQESENSSFLRSVSVGLAENVSTLKARKEVLKVFPVGGNYSVELPKPIVRGRLIVLQDLFLGATYKGCNGRPDAAPGAAQLEWLREELTKAHAKHEQVWVMAHIPTGVNVYATAQKDLNACSKMAPQMFLGDQKLADMLTDFATDVRLVIFAHSHTDEMRLLQGAAAEGRKEGGKVVVKIVPSVSPINGNAPGFTVAEVETKTAWLKDYRVMMADNATGVKAKWTEEYRYSAVYHRPGFRVEDVAAIAAGFNADRDSATPQVQAYEQNLMAGGGLRALALRAVWPQTACGVLNYTVEGYRACTCPAKAEPAAAKQ